jgi:hypothetical protein
MAPLSLYLESIEDPCSREGARFLGSSDEVVVDLGQHGFLIWYTYSC